MYITFSARFVCILEVDRARDGLGEEVCIFYYEWQGYPTIWCLRPECESMMQKPTRQPPSPTKQTPSSSNKQPSRPPPPPPSPMATATANPDYTTLLATLEKVQQHDFAILRLSEEISAGSRGDHTFNSDASNLVTSSPSTLQAELGHYKVPFPPSPPSLPAPRS